MPEFTVKRLEAVPADIPNFSPVSHIAEQQSKQPAHTGLTPHATNLKIETSAHLRYLQTPKKTFQLQNLTKIFSTY